MSSYGSNNANRYDRDGGHERRNDRTSGSYDQRYEQRDDDREGSGGGGGGGGSYGASSRDSGRDSYGGSGSGGGGSYGASSRDDRGSYRGSGSGGGGSYGASSRDSGRDSYGGSGSGGGGFHSGSSGGGRSDYNPRSTGDRYGPGGGGRGAGGHDRGVRAGRGGRNRHAGNVENVIAAMKTFTFSENTKKEVMDILTAPTGNHRHGSVPETPRDESERWRYEASDQLGVKLEPDGSTFRRLHVNCFRVNTTAIPEAVFQYHVRMKQIDAQGNLGQDEVNVKEDLSITMDVMNTLIKKAGWNFGTITYDGRSTLFSAVALPCNETEEKQKPNPSHYQHNPRDKTEETTMVPCTVQFYRQDVDVKIIKRRYQVTIEFNKEISCSTDATDKWRTADNDPMRALDMALTSFARWDYPKDDKNWIVAGNKVFSAKGEIYPLPNAFVAMHGYFANLKCSMSGLILMSDMNVSCFIASGHLVNVCAAAGGYGNMTDFVRDAKRGLSVQVIEDIMMALKGVKIRCTHTNFTKKFKGLGAAANSSKSKFNLNKTDGADDNFVTVAEYFETMAKMNAAYSNVMDNGYLRYPDLPCINVGSDKRPVLVPMELIQVSAGQINKRKLDPRLTQEIVKQAAVRPQDRMAFLEKGDSKGISLLKTLESDPTACAYGINMVDKEALAVTARILPNALLQYKTGVINPQLEGSWKMQRQARFFSNPPNSIKGGYIFGVLVARKSSNNRWPNDFQAKSDRFVNSFVSDAKAMRIDMQVGGPMVTCSDDKRDLEEKLKQMKNGGSRIVLVILIDDVYNSVKLVGDLMGMVTQCVRWKAVERTPSGYHQNVMLKVNAKMGGTNHTLKPRSTSDDKPVEPECDASGQEKTFQYPPKSLSWLFEKPCMLMGVHVMVSESGGVKCKENATAAVVGSVDGCASQYVAMLSALKADDKSIGNLQHAAKRVLQAFNTKNGELPANIVVYRDGVSDGEFPIVLEEVLEIKNAIRDIDASRMDGEDPIKIAAVVCQKGHHMRFAFEEKTASGQVQYINPCPGMVIDASHPDSVTSSTYNEFYLCSHAAIQGTSKPCKYTLLFDEIGLKMSELELLTYWSTYLYARCNKSVSMATPAYYAYWAAKRCKAYLAAGGDEARDKIDEINNQWVGESSIHPSSMFFI